MEEGKEVEKSCSAREEKKRLAGGGRRGKLAANGKKKFPTKKELAQLQRDWDHCT